MRSGSDERRKMTSQTMMSSPHGIKRRGDESLESDQRLSKRFNLLNLGEIYSSRSRRDMEISNCCVDRP